MIMTFKHVALMHSEFASRRAMRFSHSALIVALDVIILAFEESRGYEAQ